MARLIIRYVSILIAVYLVMAFVCAEFNPIAWHWVGRLFTVIFFVALTAYLDIMENLIRKK